MNRIGFIGAGNMAQALIEGLISSKLFTSEQVMVSDTLEKRVDHVRSAYNVKPARNNKHLSKESDIVVLSVKPDSVSGVLEEIKAIVNSKKIIVSIAAGITTSFISKIIKKKAKIVRVMPNTPALVLAGASALYCNPHLSPQERENVKEIFKSVGVAYMVSKESQLDAVTGLSGSGPAFASIFIESLSEGGVKMGLSREMSLALATQTVYGTAKMIRQGDDHPAELKDKVSSPGGTTIEGIYRLEQGGFRASVISAVEAATLRSRKLSEEEN